MGGTYALILAVPALLTTEVGALGSVSVPPGGYAYVGSALGSGGFARVARHRRLAAGDHDARHWHVDYLLGHPGVTLEGVVAAPDRDCECDVASGLGPGPGPSPGPGLVDGFGASDCDCASHLARRETVAEVRRAVERSFLAASASTH